MRVLVIDIGGTHVKLYATNGREPLKIDSGPTMTPNEMVKAVKTNTSGWKYDVISIGYPGPVVHGKPLSEPANLGKGWIGFDFEKAFGPTGEAYQRCCDASSPDVDSENSHETIISTL